MNVEKYGRFTFGNVLRDDFVDAVETPKFRSVFEDIQAGILRCRDSCARCAPAWADPKFLAQVTNPQVFVSAS
ncbi:MAG: hypothetical protein JO232_14055 [Verrucomicrobia bacterium]|nr:hypothetical protein [Verrucomicrobiota bacterium]